MKDRKELKKQLKKLTSQQKQFITLMNNYATSLCLCNETQSINELCEIIKYQNERRLPK